MKLFKKNTQRNIMLPSQSLLACFSKFFQFSGRAVRSEFWWFFLFVFIVNAIADAIQAAFFASVIPPFDSNFDLTFLGEEELNLTMTFNVISQDTNFHEVLSKIFAFSPISSFLDLVTLALMVPFLSAGSRRLHDIGKSGWWQLLMLTGIGFLLLLYWWAQPSTQAKNKYDKLK